LYVIIGLDRADGTANEQTRGTRDGKDDPEVKPAGRRLHAISTIEKRRYPGHVAVDDQGKQSQTEEVGQKGRAPAPHEREGVASTAL
jgi:hypothetical protein